MSDSIHDDVARSFALGVYGGLGERESIAAAYRQGRAAIGLEGCAAQIVCSSRFAPESTLIDAEPGRVDERSPRLHGVRGRSAARFPQKSSAAT